ncbi:MAG: N-acetyl sugar amidotransferase [Saprospiraceae bacterium]|nr:N-acetyl sugar amidotransferase [Pyrinomonadaceae bacterium]
MKIRRYQQCKRCVMDTTDLEIDFNESGHCNHCEEFLKIRAKHTYQGKESDDSLNRTVDAMKRAGRGKDYDCVIGVSGGVDSSYLAYVVKQKGLRPLAVHMDNGWNSEKAVINIKKITQRLRIDYESFVLDWEEFKDVQLSFLKASIPEAETPTDVAISAVLHHFAAKYKVKYIVGGGNMATEGILPKSWHYNAKDLKYFNHIHKTFGSMRLKKFPTFGYRKETYYKLMKGIRIIYPLNFVPFDKDDAIKILEEKFDWKYYGGKHHESRYTKFIQSYYIFEKFGIDYRRAALSIQICCGETRRDDAIEQLKTKPYDLHEIEEGMQYISKKLSISRDELEGIVNLPAKWYWDYPNDDKKLGIIYDTYRFLFNKEKLDRF